MSSSRRAGLAIVTVVLSVLLAAPAFTQNDDFPVSSQPMFAVTRSETAEFVSARGIDADGQAIALDIGELAATDDPLVAEAFFLNADREGRLGAVCGDILDRVGDGVAAVEIISSRHNLDAGVSPAPATEIEVLERCGS